MPTIEVQAGERFSIHAWGTDKKCQLVDFLEQLKEEANSDFSRLLYLIIRTANNGPPYNEKQCRALQGKKATDLFEFKAPNGARIIWFYDANKIIVCSHGFTKKKDRTDPEEIDRAQTIKTLYLEEKKRKEHAN